MGRNVVVCGRVAAADANERLTLDNVLLEGTNGMTVRLSFKAFAARAGAKVSLFPGQMLVVEGACAQYGGVKTIMVERVYEGEPWAAPARVVTKTGLSVWVSNGPFTSGSDLTFDALAQLMADVQANPPGLLVLLGPFVSASHPLIASGAPTLRAVKGGASSASAATSGEDPVVTLDFVFREFLKRLQAWLRNASATTRVVLVPSPDDAVHPVPGFPQPPLDLSDYGLKPEMSSRILSMPNPCTFRVTEEDPEADADADADAEERGMVVGIANIDVLKHFAESGSPAVGYTFQENFARLIGQWTAQRSFYPVYPPPPDASVDSALRDLVDMPPVDVLVVPSSNHQNAAVELPLASVLCVNPGRAVPLKKSLVVAKVWVPPASTSDAAVESGGASDAGSIVKRARVQFDSIEVEGNASSS